MSAGQPDDYEKVSIYHLEDEDREALLSMVRECVFNWCTREEWPMGVIMSCLWKDGRLWLTAGGHRHRISAVRRNPKVSVVVTSTGTPMGTGRSITIKGRCEIHEDPETKSWFYPEFADHLNPGNDENARRFEKMLDSPIRVVLEVIPEKFITYDGMKMARHTVGKLDESELGEPQSADRERLQKELERRGLG